MLSRMSCSGNFFVCFSTFIFLLLLKLLCAHWCRTMILTSSRSLGRLSSSMVNSVWVFCGNFFPVAPMAWWCTFTGSCTSLTETFVGRPVHTTVSTSLWNYLSSLSLHGFLWPSPPLLNFFSISFTLHCISVNRSWPPELDLWEELWFLLSNKVDNLLFIRYRPNVWKWSFELKHSP